MSHAVLPRPAVGALSLPVLLAASLCHFLNDMMQSLFTATYPVFKAGFDLSFGQIGMLTLVYQLSASILQPLVGLFTDARPQPYSLPVGMGFSMAGLLTLAYAPSYGVLLLGGALLGVGSSIFHPESSRLARVASGGAHGLAQSIFQVGGNLGTALGPLLVAFVVLPSGQASLAWFALAAFAGMAVLTTLGRWYSRNGHARPLRAVEPRPATSCSATSGALPVPPVAVMLGHALLVLLALQLSTLPCQLRLLLPGGALASAARTRRSTSSSSSARWRSARWSAGRSATGSAAGR